MSATEPLLYLDRPRVETLLPYDRCVDLMRQATAVVSARRALQPIRTGLRLPDGSGILGMMPGYLEEPKCLGIKVVTVFPDGTDPGSTDPDSTEGGHGSHQGFVLLFDADRGTPQAIVDAGAITAIRTAATSALASLLLARPEARELGLLGCGEQARSHLAAHLAVRELDEVRVWGRDPAKAAAFAQQQGQLHGITIDVVEQAAQAVAGVGIVCTVTAASSPVLRGEWLQAGTHLNVVGSSVPSDREIDDEALQRSRIFVDYYDSALALGGEIRAALAAKSIAEDDIIGELGEVVSGAKVGRGSSEEITLFKSLGMVSEDLLAARYVVERARAGGIGEELS